MSDTFFQNSHGFCGFSEIHRSKTHTAGVLPLKLQAQTPITDPKMKFDTPMPDYVKNYERGLKKNE